MDSLKKSVIRFIDNYPHSFVLSKPEPGSAENVFVSRLSIKVSAKKAPDWAVIIGDFAHNARSALDVLLTQALASSDEVHFPIRLDGPAYGKWRSTHNAALGYLSTGQLAVIKRAQPYKATPETPAADPLAFLTTLNNGDKHSLVNAAIGYFGASQLGFTPHPYIRQIEILTTGAGAEDGATLALIIVTATRPDFTMEVQPLPAFDVFFDRTAQHPANVPVVPMLTAIYDRVHGIVADFEREA